MRIIKLSANDEDMKTRDMVDLYFKEKLPNRERGRFLLTKGRISEKGIAPGEMIIFSYGGEIVYLALSQSERLKNPGPNSGEYPFYFCVDIETIIEGKGNLKQLENEIKATKSIARTRGWPIIKDSPGTERIWNQFKAQ
jgi:hypothetical protein